MDMERSRRHASKLLTYPITVGSVIHQYSALTLGNQRLTPEGSRSLAGGYTNFKKRLSNLQVRRQLCDGPYTVLRERLRLKKHQSTNLKCEYLSLARGRNLLCLPTFGNSSRFCSRRHYFISTLSGHRFLSQSLQQLRPQRPMTPRQKQGRAQLALPRARRQKPRPLPRLLSPTRKSQSIYLTCTNLQLLLPFRDISVLGLRSNVMAYHPIRCHTHHN